MVAGIGGSTVAHEGAGDDGRGEAPSGVHRAARARSRFIEETLGTGVLTSVLQPVVDLRNGVVVGAEALARFQSNPPLTPDVWFAKAWECGDGVELETAAVRAALSHLGSMPDGMYLAVNVSPETLLDPSLQSVLAGVAGPRLVLELTEHARVDDYDALRSALAGLRKSGVRLAVDDAGAGFASFQHILQLRPDVIKLDRTLTSGVDRDASRSALASALVTFATTLNIQICAEGIETVGELVALQRLGVRLGQGFLLGRPAAGAISERVAGPWLTPHGLGHGEDPGEKLDLLGQAGSSAPDVRLLTDRPSPAVLDPARLGALRSTGLLDSAPEESFDRFTELAARMLSVPTALVSLVDERRQFFKSAVGLGEPWASRRETPLSYSLCQHVVTMKAPLIVSDALAHPLCRDSKGVKELGVRAYAGVPLVTSDDHALGALCVVVQETRVWTEKDVLVLRQLAAAVVSEIEARRALRKVAERDATFRAVFQHAPLGMLVCDEAGRLIRVNARFSAMLGYHEEELCGVPLESLRHPDDATRDARILEELFADRRDEAKAETRFRLRSGAWLVARITIAMARDEIGGAYAVAMVEEVDEVSRARSALRVSEERFRALAKNLPNTSILVFDNDLRFVSADGDTFLRGVGTSREEVEGRRIEDVTAPENVACLMQVYRATLAGSREHIEVARNGRRVAIYTSPLHDEAGRVTGGMVMAHDIAALKRTEEALKEQTAAFELLELVAAAVNDASTRGVAFLRVLGLVVTHMGWAVGHVYLREGDELVASDLWHFADPSVAGVLRTATRDNRFRKGDGFIGGVFESRESAYVLDLPSSNEGPRSHPASLSGLTAAFAFPVIAEGEVAAVLEFYGDHGQRPASRTLTLMAHVSTQLGRVLEREKHAAIQALSLRDELTGLLNRRGFLELGRKQHEASVRAMRPLVLMFADLNGMKAINDQMGHEAGDSALRDTADLLRTVFRQSDLIARLGGDEFVALAVDTDAVQAGGLKMRVQDAVVAFNDAYRRPYRLSVSLGVATFDAAAPLELEGLLSQADVQMYEQKRIRRLGRSHSTQAPPLRGTESPVSIR